MKEKKVYVPPRMQQRGRRSGARAGVGWGGVARGFARSLVLAVELGDELDVLLHRLLLGRAWPRKKRTTACRRRSGQRASGRHLSCSAAPIRHARARTRTHPCGHPRRPTWPCRGGRTCRDALRGPPAPPPRSLIADPRRIRRARIGARPRALARTRVDVADRGLLVKAVDREQVLVARERAEALGQLGGLLEARLVCGCEDGRSRARV